MSGNLHTITSRIREVVKPRETGLILLLAFSIGLGSFSVLLSLHPLGKSLGNPLEIRGLQSSNESGGNTPIPSPIVCALLFQNPPFVTLSGIVSDFTAVPNNYGGYDGAAFTLNTAGSQNVGAPVRVVLRAFGPQQPSPEGAEEQQQTYSGYVPTNQDLVNVTGTLWNSQGPATSCENYTGPYVAALSVEKVQVQSSLNANPTQEGLGGLAFKARPELSPDVSKDVVVSAPFGSTSTVLEPAVATNGNNVFYTGNWFAARSTDGGTSWGFVNPFSNNFTTPWNFCCDQDVVYDPTQGIFIWYRQGARDRLNENKVLLDSSIDAATWCEWTLSPKSTKTSWAGSWWDYPHLALTQNFLFITTNRYPSSSQFSDILRIPLAQLKSCGSFSMAWWESESETIVPVEGASKVMFLAKHISESKLRVYEWADSLGSPSYAETDHPSFLRTNKGEAHCKDPSGGNACGRFGDRVLGGWVRFDDELGFIWNVKEGDGKPYPYTDVIVIDVNPATYALSYSHSPFLGSSDYAIIFGSVAVNSLGFVGLAGFIAGPTKYPSVVLGWRGYSGFSPYGAPAFAIVTPGTSGPFGGSGGSCVAPDCWGDYVRVRPAYGFASSKNWVAAGYVLTGGTSGLGAGSFLAVEPHYYIFGPNIETTTVTVTGSVSSATSGYTPTTASPTITVGNTLALPLFSTILISSNSTIAGANYDSSKHAINFTTNGQDGTVGFTTVIFARYLIDGSPNLLIDNMAVGGADVASNSTHFFLSFTYPQSQHAIAIVGSNTIPEFPSQPSLWSGLILLVATAFILHAGLSRSKRPRLE
jgi:hypothetical protein